MESFKLAKKGDKASKNSLFNWGITEEELDRQVNGYDSLGITQSYRGMALLAVLFSMALTVALTALNVAPLSNVYSLVIYLPLAALIYFGHRWAIIAMMVLWTMEKAYSVTTGSSPVLALIWWSIYMGVFYKALRVEKARKQEDTDDTSTASTASTVNAVLIGVIVLILIGLGWYALSNS
jgi:heme/copper-type cytochrome/quinol oxidase subunit 2